jgi:very-short-patch-repair endonuclease
MTTSQRKSKGLISTGYHLPYNPKLKERARELRNNMTSAERKLWLKFLKKLPITFLRQKPLDNFIVDFYCASASLVIEVDGDSHYSENGIPYDAQRTKVLEGYGLKVLRFTNNDVKNRFKSVCDEIDRAINPPIPPLKQIPLYPL